MSIKLMSQIWDNAPYKGSDLLTLLALADMANDSGKCWPSISTLANRARVKPRQIRYILSRLEEDGVIDRILRTGKSNIYEINFLPLHSTAPPDPLTPAPHCTPPLHSTAPRTNTEAINNTETIKPLLQEIIVSSNTGQVVVVGEDKLEWPINRILLSAGKSFSFVSEDQAKNFVSKWLYAVSQEKIKSPVLFALSKLNVDPDPVYLKLVNDGPGCIVSWSRWGIYEDKHIAELHRHGVHKIIETMLEIAPPDDNQDTYDNIAVEPEENTIKHYPDTEHGNAWIKAMEQWEDYRTNGAYRIWDALQDSYPISSSGKEIVILAQDGEKIDFLNERMGKTASHLITGMLGYEAHVKFVGLSGQCQELEK